MTKSQQAPSSVPYRDELDLHELFRVLWAGKWLVGGITLAATVIAIIAAFMLPNIYRAEALLAPNDQEGAAGLSALAAQYGGLASLAGISIGNDTADKTALGTEVLKSRKFISEFIERHDILVPLMAAQAWDAEAGELQLDADDYDVKNKTWVRKVSPPKKTIPSLQEAYDEFMDILSVSVNKKSGFITVAVEHLSPRIAQQWVGWLVEDVNSTIMRQDLSEAEQAINFLHKQVESTSLAELQKTLFKLIEEQTRTVMLAQVSDEYLFRTIDPAVEMERPSRPKRVLIAVLGLLGGLGLGLLSVLLLRMKKFRNSNP